MKSDSPIISSLTSVLQYCGHRIILYDKSKYNCYAIFHKENPDYMVFLPDQITEEVMDMMTEKRSSKYIFLGYAKENLNAIGTPYDPLPCANIAQRMISKSDSVVVKSWEIYTTDMLYFYYSSAYNYIVEYLQQTKFKTKIYSDYPVNSPLNLGKLEFEYKKSHAMINCRLFLDTNGWDFLDAAALGVETFSASLNPLIYPPDLFYSFRDETDFNLHVESILNFNLTKDIVSRRKEFIFDNHTSFHRAAELLNILGHEDKGREVMQKWENIRSVY